MNYDKIYLRYMLVVDRATVPVIKKTSQYLHLEHWFIFRLLAFNVCKCFGHSLECLLSRIIDITEHTSTLKFGYLGSTAVYITIVGTSFDGALLTGLWEFFKLSCDFDFCVPDGTYRVYKKIITHIKISSSFGVHKYWPLCITIQDSDER